MRENHQVDALRAAIRTRLASQPSVKSGKFGPGPDDSVTASAIRARLAAQPTVKSGKFGPGPEE
jgi:hypothetical protein